MPSASRPWQGQAGSAASPYHDAVSTSEVWGRFEHDPRDPQYAGLRASDLDRAVVSDLLAGAYAEGRLDRDELDERTAAVTSARTYAELVPPISDLTLDAGTPTRTTTATDTFRRRAELDYANGRREAVFEFLVPVLICWTIWYLTGRGFLWPLFVTIPVGLNALRVLSSRGSYLENRVAKLERREAKALEVKTEEAKTEEAKTEDPQKLEHTQSEPE